MTAIEWADAAQHAVTPISAVRGPVSAIAIAPSGGGFAIGTHREVLVWDRGDHPPWTAPAPRRLRTVESLSFSGDGTLLAAGAGALTCLWRTADRSLVWSERSQGFCNEIAGVAVSPDGRYVAVGTWSDRIDVRDASSGAIVAELHHPASLDAVAFSREGRLLVGAAGDQVAVWEHAAGTRVCLLAHQSRVRALAFSPASDCLATAAADCTVRLWDTASWQQTGQLQHGQAVRLLAFDPRGRRLAAAGPHRTVRLWDARVGVADCTVMHQRKVRALAFVDEDHLLVGDDDGAVLLDLTRPVAPATPERLDTPAINLPLPAGDDPDDNPGSDAADADSGERGTLWSILLLIALLATLPWLIALAMFLWDGADVADPRTWGWLWREVAGFAVIAAAVGAGRLSLGIVVDLTPWRGEGAVAKTAGLLAASAVGLSSAVMALEAGEDPWYPKTVGECFLMQRQDVGVDCAQPHDGEVFFVGDHPAAEDEPYDGQQVDQWAEQRCDGVFEHLTGRAETVADDHTYVYWTPTRRSWDEGDRWVACAFTTDSGAPLEDTLVPQGR